MSTATRRAVYGKLAGDVTLNGLLGAPVTGYSKAIYYQQAPADAGYPLVIFQRQSGIPTQTMGDPSALETEVWLIKAIDRSTSTDGAEAAAARVVALLNDTTLSISGSTLLYLRRESDVEYSETDEGTVYKHAGSLFRLISTD